MRTSNRLKWASRLIPLVMLAVFVTMIGVAQSGTTSVVAKRLGRSFTGVELNPDYVRIGMKRLDRENS